MQKTAPKNTKSSRNETIFKIGHDAKAIAHAKSSLWVKNYDSKTHVKIHSINQLQLFGAKNRFKKHQIFEKWDFFQNRPSCKGYSPCKILTLGQKLKFKKHVIIHSTNYLELFCAKNRSKKHQIFEKWDHFQNRPSCKGYSPCKILTLGQKLSFQNTCQNPLYKSYTVVLCQKNASENTKYSRNESIFKIGHHAKTIAHVKSSLWVKNYNSKTHVKIHSINHIQLFCAKKTL